MKSSCSEVVSSQTMFKSLSKLQRLCPDTSSMYGLKCQMVLLFPSLNIGCIQQFFFINLRCLYAAIDTLKMTVCSHYDFVQPTNNSAATRYQRRQSAAVKLCFCLQIVSPSGATFCVALDCCPQAVNSYSQWSQLLRDPDLRLRLKSRSSAHHPLIYLYDKKRPHLITN